MERAGHQTRILSPFQSNVKAQAQGLRISHKRYFDHLYLPPYKPWIPSDMVKRGKESRKEGYTIFGVDLSSLEAAIRQCFRH